MCEFASMILTKDSEFWGPTESHTDIIEHHHLHEDGCRGPNILRVEITPPSGNPQAPIEQWNYRTDQDQMPEWFDPDLCEQRARTALMRRAQEERWFLLGDGKLLTGGYASTLTGGNRSTLTGGNRSTLTGGDDSTLTGGNRSTLTGGNRSTLTGGYDSTLIIKWYDGSRFRVLSADVGENGIESNVPYHVVDGKLVKKC
jgi:hypothetical protein